MLSPELERAKRRLVAALRDPSKVVIDRRDMYEDADGNPVGSFGHTRGCLVVLAYDALPGRGGYLMDAAVYPALGRSAVKVFEDFGPDYCADKIEAYA